MRGRVVKYSVKATKEFLNIYYWYRQNVDLKAADKFKKGIQSTVKLIADMPQIGCIDQERSDSRRIYRSFRSGPHYRIVYRYTESMLYVLAIRDMRMSVV